MKSELFSTRLDIASPGGRGLSHAYIVYGDGGRDMLALRIAAALLCSGSGDRPCGECINCTKVASAVHPDAIIVDRLEDKREISIDQIRAVREDAYIVPNEAERKVYIIKNAGLMNTAAQNALLKVLEEPPASAAFILVAASEEELLVTVRSRCVPVQSFADGDETEPSALADEFIGAALSGGAALCEFSFRLDKLGGAEMTALLEQINHAAVQRLKAAEQGGGRDSAKLMRIISAVDEVRKYAALYVSSVHIAGRLCAQLL